MYDKNTTSMLYSAGNKYYTYLISIAYIVNVLNVKNTSTSRQPHIIQNKVKIHIQNCITR